MKIYKSGLRPNGLAKLTFIILLILYLALLAYLVYFSQYYGREYTHRSVNYVPFKTILQYLRLSGSPGIVATNILGNIVAFVPMGLLFPMSFRKLNTFKSVMLIVLIATSSIEVSQYIAGVGACDVDDILLNLIGGAIGYGFYFLKIIMR